VICYVVPERADVLNLDFDYRRYLGALSENGFNLTRLFSGAYREIPGSFGIVGNTLAPAPTYARVTANPKP
jgi:hypothetical protein